MAITQLSPEDIFSVRIFKHLATNPLMKWSNTYEFRATMDVGVSVCDSAIQAVTQFERAIATSAAVFDYAIASTGVRDSQPYNGDEFYRTQLNMVGARPANVDQPVPQEICLRIAFGAVSGRTGFRLYRASLFPAEVKNSAGQYNFNDRTAITGIVNNAISTSFLADWMLGGENGAVLVLANDINVREISNIGLAGITIKKLNNKWFNRRPDAPPPSP